MRRPLLLALAALVVVAGLVAWRLTSSGTAFEEAVAMVPADSERVTWTDWAGVRRALDADLDVDSSAEDVTAFLDEAHGRDLTSSSALVSSAATSHDRLGFSPATLEWEVLAQSTEGAAVIMKLASSEAAAQVADRLEGLGWDEADGAWIGGPDVLAGLGGTLTPELQHFVVLEDEAILIASDRAGHVTRVAEAVRGDAERVSGFDDVSERLASPLAAVVYSGNHACEKLAMAQADDAAQAEAEQLVEQAGGVHPLTAFAMGQLPSGDVRVAMEIEDADDAEAEATTRAALAAGPAPGQGGEFGERFSVERAAAKGRVITLDLAPREGQDYVLSDLSTGPVLFATC